MTEIFKQVPTLTLFECTNDGKIRKRGTLLNKECNTIIHGYNMCKCYGRSYRLDKLIAETWVPNPKHYKYLIHIDGDKTNNNASNLCWVEKNPNQFTDESNIFKQIPSVPEYECNQLGEIRRRSDHKKPSTWLNQKRYCVNCDGTKYILHRLIAETWIPNPNSFKFVTHIDGNQTNNVVSNLEWR